MPERTIKVDKHLCHKCNCHVRIVGERYCKVCRKEMISCMKHSSYFVPIPAKTYKTYSGQSSGGLVWTGEEFQLTSYQ